MIPFGHGSSKTELEKEEEDARKHTQLKKPNQTQEK
jgi:hypothetical protein